jgi:hypothetical protein
MLRYALPLLAVLAAAAAEDPWDKVRDLKGGTELRIIKRGAKQPVLAKFDELTAESLVIVVKNEQVAIPREDIDRIDYRPMAGSRVKPESNTTVKGPGDPDAKRPGPPTAYPGSSTSTSTALSIGSKPDFKTVYRRMSPLPEK